MENIFQGNASLQEITVLDVRRDYLSKMLDFVYLGEIEIPRGHVAEFRATADRLGIVGDMDVYKHKN